MIRVGFIGCGHRGTRMAECYETIEDVELIAACDIDEGRLEAFRKRFGIPNGYQRYEDMLARENLDIVHLATQPTLRREPILAAAEKRVKVILTEKPVALSLPELDEMLEACERNDVKLIINHQLRYQSPWRRLKSAIEQKEIGDLTFLFAHTRMNALEQGTHLLDLILWLRDERLPERVFGDAYGDEDFKKTHSAPRTVLGVLVFPDGVRCLVHMGPEAPELPDAEGFSMNLGIQAVGTDGRAQAWLGRWHLFKNPRDQTAVRIPYGDDDRNAQIALQKDLIHAVMEPGFRHPCDAHLGRASLELIEALCLSSLEKRQISLPLPKGTSPLATMREKASW